MKDLALFLFPGSGHCSVTVTLAQLGNDDFAALCSEELGGLFKTDLIGIVKKVRSTFSYVLWAVALL